MFRDIETGALMTDTDPSAGEDLDTTDDGRDPATTDDALAEAADDMPEVDDGEPADDDTTPGPLLDHSDLDVAADGTDPLGPLADADEGD